MATAIKLKNAKRVLLDNVVISGFNRGIEAINSDFALSNSNVRRNVVGVDLTNSDAIIHNSQLVDNAIDIVVNKSRVQLIDTIAYRILEILPKGDCRMNPYQIERIAYSIINTRDIQEKKRNLSQLLKYLKNYTHIWGIYQIIKEILRWVGYPIP